MPYTHWGRSRTCVHPLKNMQIRNNIVLWQTIHKFIHKFTQSVLRSTVFLIITPYFCWQLLLSLKWTNKGDIKLTTPFQCLRKPAPEAAAASGYTLQTDDRNVNIIETTESHPGGWYYSTRYRKRGRCYRNFTSIRCH